MFAAPTPLPDDPAALRAILLTALAEIERLRLMLAGLQRNRFGRRSEQLNAEQLQQSTEDLEQAVGEQNARVEAAVPASAGKTSRAEPPQRNRGALPAHLPRIEVTIDVDEQDKICPCYGIARHVIGEDRAEMLDYTPAAG